ncbi:MAG: hypothetical protein AABX34_05140 [Nanoarchaeota archaeon]
MESNGNLSLDEQVTLIEKVEGAYKASDKWKTLTGRYGEYAVLHHPYKDIASTAGEVLLSTLLESMPPNWLEIVENRKNLVPMILGEGGTLTFDSEFEIGFRTLLTDGYLQRSDLFKISNAAWERRIIGYVEGIVPVLKDAIGLEDTPENEDRIGYTHHDLLDLVAFTQTYLIAKKQGMGTVKEQMPALQRGELVYQPN